MLAELSPLEGTGSSDEGVPLSASLCFGFLYVFEVKSMQLRGTTLAQPQTCCKTKFFLLSSDMFKAKNHKVKILIESSKKHANRRKAVKAQM